MIYGYPYCGVCGAKCEPVQLEGFDTKTGERHVQLTCPTGLCGHGGVFHGYAAPWRRTCKTCGEKLPMLDDYY